MAVKCRARKKLNAAPKALPEPERRIVCPGCGCPDVPVIYRRPGYGSNDQAFRRRRECRHCGRRFMTVEKSV